MTFLFKLTKSVLIGFAALTLVACQTTNKSAETVEEFSDNFEYIEAAAQAEQEQLQQELEQAQKDQEKLQSEAEQLQAEADKAREAQALAEERALAEEQARAAAEERALKEAEARAKAQAEADALKAEAEAAASGEAGVVNDVVPLGTPTDSVYFDFDKSFIVPKFDDVITSHAEYLRANPDLNVEIQGNCDERGSREYNIGLGNRRALAVKAALEILGVAGGRITITSFGSEKPVAMGHDESSWQQNRRADFAY
ncbi:MAG: peptidoglycan-associated lipoprotein Pal [Betaproteobacteria bacterium]|jgi:peptidoglycan-associated lipoprotein|nr:peptidoglycan-associated lipoprotein Pal [Betaproteobacteria bacterium]MBT6529486.1 peptidoglycan-associated lipoprotein Pal [Betaproteobacteria bacterium]MBT7998757.1 peptidoglycan-associated lipoprotein Pal [Betaproteobacteria bacterium]MDG2203050.1 peptidoglycan-associated lipoprotein Pal [Burkholderiales bacterium]